MLYNNVYTIPILWRKKCRPKTSRLFTTKRYNHSLRRKVWKADQDTKDLLQEDYSINFQNIADEWKSKVVDGPTRNTRKYMVKKACDILEKEKLVFYPNGEKELEIRPEEKLDNLMRYYYLLEDRIKEINQIFRIGDDKNA